jgi:superfamily II DNA or RNA helicase
MFELSDFSEDFGSKTPRDYQISSVNEVARYLEQGFRRIEVIGPTGCGKTLTSKLIALSKKVRKAIGHEDDVMRILFLSNRHRLNRQAMEEYADCTTVEIIPQSAFSSIPESVLNAGWDLVMIDECHHEAMTSIQVLLEKLTRTPIVGFTADNQRNDAMLCKFDRTVLMISEQEAAEKGYIEKAGINTVIDYSDKHKAALALDIVGQYGECMGNTIAFFRTVNEVEEFHLGLLERGFTSVMLDSSSTESDLDEALAKLSTGEAQFLSNCERVGEGIDAPNVSDVMLMRSFKSRAQMKQFVGRAIRIDSPCASWELINPLEGSAISTAECVGGIKYKRLIHKKNGEWLDELTYGTDNTWGQMRQLRVQPHVEGAVVIEPITVDSLEPIEEARETGSAINIKALGIDANTYSDAQAMDRIGAQSLSNWIQDNTQMKLFDSMGVDDSTAIFVEPRRLRKAA